MSWRLCTRSEKGILNAVPLADVGVHMREHELLGLVRGLLRRRPVPSVQLGEERRRLKQHLRLKSHEIWRPAVE